MSDLEIGVQLLHPAAQVPRYAHVGAWGDLAADLYAAEAVTLAAGATALVRTGLGLVFPDGFGALVEDRSGLAVRGVTTLAGVIDPGYRGEVKVVLLNSGAVAHEVAVGDRVAQLRVVRRLEAAFRVVESVEETARAGAGFGSTGR